MPGDHWQDACAVESLCRAGAFKALLEQEFGDLDDVHCPVCGSTAYWKRRPLFRASAAIAMLFLTGVVLPPVGWVCFCKACGAKFRAPLYERAPGEWLNIFAVIGCEAVALALAVFGVILLDTQYWLVPTLAVAMVAGLWARRWVASLDAEPE